MNAIEFGKIILKKKKKNYEFLIIFFLNLK
jgi:hypothetical protein